MGNLTGSLFDNSGGNLIVTDLEVDGTTLSIDAANNRVGIGTDSPSTALEVDGVVTATSFTIGSAAITEAELEVLDGATLSTTELNYVDGVTSAIQTQLDGKSPVAGHSSIATVGTITSGTWQGTAVASAYLDSDTAHLSGTQTFSGAKTFTADFGVTTANHSITVDVSEDEMILAADTKLSFHDAGGGENILASADGHLEVNAGTTLDATAPTIDLNATTKVIVDSPTVQLFSGTTNKPLISLECTNPDALGGIFQFVKNGSSVADNDVVGTIKFVSEDDSSAVHTYANIESTISDMTAGSEGGSISISVASHDGELQPGLTLQDGDVEDEIDAFIANGSGSVTSVAGSLSAVSGVVLKEGSSLNIEAPLLGAADHTSAGETANMVCSAAIAIRNLVAVSSAGKVANADANAEASMPVIGMAMNATSSDGDAVTVLLRGMVRDDTWNWTAGNRLFASGDSTTTNGLTATAPSVTGDFVQCVAVALSDDVIYLNPSFTLVEVG
jgi:hypothetical protein